MKRGITLINLLVYVGILLVVVAIAIPMIATAYQRPLIERQPAGLPAPGPMIPGAGVRFHTQMYRGHWYIVLGRDAFIHDPDCLFCADRKGTNESVAGTQQ